MDVPKAIEIADIIRMAHLATFQTQISTGMQLKIANEILENEEADAYIVVWCKCAKKYNPQPTIVWLANLPMT